MFIINFFTGSVIRLVFGFVFMIILLLVAATALVGVLAATGGPGACTPGGVPLTVDAANAVSWQQKWDAMNVALDGGAPSSAAFNESELSSRADEYLEDHDVGFSEPRICIHDGFGEGSATFSQLGIDVKVKARGTVDLTGEHPDAKIDKMEIGNVPGWLTGPVEGLVNRAIDAALDDATLDHDYAPTLTEGQASVNGTP